MLKLEELVLRLPLLVHKLAMRHKHGYVSPATGLVFWSYNPKSKNGEVWLSPDKFKERKERARITAKARYKKDPSRNIASTMRWMAKNKEHINRYKREWPKTPSGKLSTQRTKARGAERSKKWAKQYMQTAAFKARNRRRANERRYIEIKPLGNLTEVDFLYGLSATISSATGIRHVVDHIYPIKPASKNYCGLHSSQNLRVCSSRENAVKYNKDPSLNHL